MQYLDYPRARNAEPAIRRLLMSLYLEDTCRRIKNSFPEFFTFEKPEKVPVERLDIIFRKEALETDKEDNELHDDEDFYPALLDWFGLKYYQFEYRTDGIVNDDYLPLPQEFELERGEDYDGLSWDEYHVLWIVSLPTSLDGENVDHLVIEVQDVSEFEDPVKFFLTTIVLSDITT